MIDDFMGKVDTAIRIMLIRDNCGTGSNRSVGKFMQHFSGASFYNSALTRPLRSNIPTTIVLPLNVPGSARCYASFARFALCMFLALPPTKVSSISISPESGVPSSSCMTIRRRWSINHAALLGDSNSAVNFVGRNAIPAIRKHPQSAKPFVQTERRILENRFQP